jgi:hypothetical protein
VSALTGVGLAAALALLSRDHPVAVAGGGLLVFVSGVGSAGAVALAVPPVYAFGPGRVATVGCVGVAAFGAAASWTGASDGVRDALASFSYGLLPLMGAFALAAGTHLAVGAPVGRALAAAPRLAGELALDPSTATVAVVSLPLLVTLAAGGAGRLLAAAPVVELARRERRADAAAARDRAVAVCTATRLLAGVVFIVVGGLFVVGMAGSVVSAAPEVLVGVAAAGAFRATLALAAVLSHAGWMTLVVVRTVGRFQRERVAAVGAPLLAGVAVATAAATVVRSRVVAAADGLPPAAGQVLALLVEHVGEAGAVLGAVLFAVGSVLYLLASLVVAQRFGFVPERAGSVALASAGVVGLAVVAGLGGWPPLAVFGLAACGLFVWDVGEYAVVVGRELTPAARSRRVQLVHAGGSALAGVGGVALGGAVLALSRGGAGTVAPAVAFLGGVVGLLLLVGAFR